MILRFERVKVHNFSCYKDAELALSEMGYTIVSGRNNNSSDNAVSNGSGKSSIFNAVCFALTGETTQGLSNNVENIYTDPNDCWVELEFKADEDSFLIRRYKTPRSDLKIYINGEDRSGKGIKESQKILDGYLPDITSRLLGSIIILGQGLPYRFTMNAPSQRKYLLEKLTKSDYMVQTVKDKLELRKEELRSILRGYEDKNIAIKTEIKMLFSRLDKLKLDIKECEDVSSEGSIEDKLIDIRECISKYNDNLVELTNNKRSLDDSINKLLLEKSSIAISMSSGLNERLATANSELDELVKIIAEKDANIKSVNNEIKKLESVKDVCPTCGQKILGVHKVDTSDLHAKVLELQNSVLVDRGFYKSISDKKEDIIKKHNDELNKTYNSIDASIEDKSNDSALIEKKISNINKNVQQLLAEEVRLQGIQNNYSRLISDYNNDSNRLEELKKEQDEIDLGMRDTNEHLKVVQELITLAKREFRSVLLDNIIRYLDKKAKQYSLDVFGAELITIKTDENYIDVIFSGKYYEALSGGEKQKVDVIIQLALRDLLSNQLNIKSNILVLDEVLDFLDEKGADSILKLIQDYTTDIDSIFMISHRVEKLNISYDTIMEVIKDSSGVSSIYIR